MKEKIFALAKLVVLLVLLGTPIAAWAKASTTEITISGGGLGRVVEVTDPRLLAMSNVFWGQFLDPSRTPLNETPPGLKAYEISFYVKEAENDVRKMYVAYYYPNVGSEQGFLYLPGGGPVWELNIGTIMRGPLDGKWSYAMRAWEALIKPVIASAEASGSQNQKVSKTSEVATGGWTKPKRGWLYVLDPRSESDRPGSRVWLVDPTSAKVMGSIRAGSDPDFALSPDGTRLYVASGERESGELAAIDTATGAVKRFPFPDRILYKPWYQALPPYSRMVVASDGGVRILVHSLFSPEKIGYQLWTFDTTNGHFLSTHVGLGNCGYGQFVLSATANQFNFICPTTNGLRSIELDTDYHEVSNTFVKFPWSRDYGVSDGFLSPNGKPAIVRGDGAIYEWNAATQEFSATAVGGSSHRIVYPFAWPRSPDGTIIYVGYGPATPDGMASSAELRVFDTSTWRQIGSIKTSVPFWSASISNDGKFAYAAVPEEHRVLVIDATTLHEISAISVGQVPALVLVAP
jgi:DNA-binding beta-propeller fold protein YncE